MKPRSSLRSRSKAGISAASVVKSSTATAPTASAHAAAEIESVLLGAVRGLIGAIVEYRSIAVLIELTAAWGEYAFVASQLSALSARRESLRSELQKFNRLLAELETQVTKQG